MLRETRPPHEHSARTPGPVERPKDGLLLRHEFEARTGDVWPLNVGQVYTTLLRLERDGLVVSDEPEIEGPQKGFHISSDGAEELVQWLHTPPDLSSPPRDELVIKVLVALEVSGVDVHDVIQVHGRRRAVPTGLCHPLARHG